MHACPLANRKSDQTAPRDALVFGSCCNASHTQLKVTCNIERFDLSRLVHPQSDACVQTVLPMSCIYVSPCLLEGRTGCTMRYFGAWELAMHHARRGSSSSIRVLYTHTEMSVCNLCHESHASTRPLAS